MSKRVSKMDDALCRRVQALLDEMRRGESPISAYALTEMLLVATDSNVRAASAVVTKIEKLEPSWWGKIGERPYPRLQPCPRR